MGRATLPAWGGRNGSERPDFAASLASLESVRRGFAFIGRNKRWIDRQHLEICRIPAPTFREQRRAEYLRKKFAEIGHCPQLDEVGNVLVPVTYGKDRPYAAVTAHMDTILAPAHPEDVRIRPDGTMEGPGVTDNGAGLSALLALARVLEAPLLPEAGRNVLLVANVAEEGEGNLQGMRYIAEHSRYAERVDRYLVVDGASIGHIAAEALGSRRFELTIEGCGGHSWNDFGRANPVHALSRAVALMADAALPDNPRVTLTVGVIEGGSGINAIPTSARAKIDVRSRDRAGIRKAVEIVEDAARKAVREENRRAADRLKTYRLREVGNRPAVAPLENNPLVDCFQAVDRYLNIPSRVDYASTDANIPLAKGLPAVTVGAGGRGGETHTPSEWYDPEGRELGLKRLVLALAGLIAPDGGRIPEGTSAS